jgi:hypothetical protein
LDHVDVVVPAAALQAIVGNDPFVVVLVRARAVPANLPQIGVAEGVLDPPSNGVEIVR